MFSFYKHHTRYNMINTETFVSIMVAIIIFYISCLFPILSVYENNIKKHKKMIIILTIIFLVLLITAIVLYHVVSPNQLFNIFYNQIMYILEFINTKQELINSEDYIIIFFSVIINVLFLTSMTLYEYVSDSYKISDKMLIIGIYLGYSFCTLVYEQYLIELILKICSDNFLLTLIITMTINDVLSICLDKIVFFIFDLEYD